MPTAQQLHETSETVLLHGIAGRGKSTLAMCAPQPHAVLLVDKPICAQPAKNTPGYNPHKTFATTYVSADVDLTDEKAKRARNVGDQILADLMAIKNALMLHKEEVAINTHTGPEKWPIPRTVILEGADFMVKHIENWLCAVHNRVSMAEWAAESDNKWFPYQLRADKLQPIYDLLTFLPSAHLCNVIVTTGIDEETKTQKVPGKDGKTKLETYKTGIVDPSLGGKMSTTVPRNFANSFLCTVEAGKWWVITKPVDQYANYRGIRSGQFGLGAKVDVTVDPAAPINIWDKLFGGGK